MEYIYVRKGPPISSCCKTYLPCKYGTCTSPFYKRWDVRNVDNEIEGVEIDDVIAYPDVTGDISVVTSDDGVIHIFQIKASEPYGLLHYYFKNNVWNRTLWHVPILNPPSLVSSPFIIKSKLLI